MLMVFYNRKARIFLVLFACFCGVPTLFAQIPSPTNDVPIKVQTTLLNVPLIVSDKEGRRISDLRKEDISVKMGSSEVEIAFFGSGSEELVYAILLDTSGSTKRVRGGINRAAKHFIETVSDKDRGMVAKFDEEVRIIQGLTTKKGNLKSAVLAADSIPGGVGLMNQALAEIIDELLKVEKVRKAVIVLTDGGEVTQGTNTALAEFLAKTDVVVYPVIHISNGILDILRLSNEENIFRQLEGMNSISKKELIKYKPFDHLHNIAAISGGRLLFAETDNFETAFQQIADELRKQYVVGVYVDADGSADAHNISIKVNRPDAVVRTKQSIRIMRP